MSASPDQLPAVAQALRAAFGTESLDGWTLVSGGLSRAGVWKIRVGGIAYLLKLDTAGGASRDRRRGQICQALAAQACLAPRLWCADPDEGVTISDWIEPRSLALDYAGTRDDRIVELAQAVRALHEIDGFPSRVDYLDALDALVEQARASGVVPAGAFEAWAGLRDVCRRLEPRPVSSHNDLNPGNLVYDGRRIWLVDWEAAFRADRYVDLAAIANAWAADPAGEALLLRTYFRREPTEGERARLWLFRQVSHLFHAAAFVAGLAGQAKAETVDGPGLDEIHQDLALGEPRLATPEGRLAYGLAHLRRASANLASAAFREAASIAD